MRRKASEAKQKPQIKYKVKEKRSSTKESAKRKVASSAKVNINKADAETLQNFLVLVRKSTSDHWLP